METYYMLMVGLLACLAVFDLVVGVSNDAVNFLNSSIGAKVASFRTILIVATIGIVCGALFSGGMMEVARKGIFHPGAFHFGEIMVIFLAVMLTDIILLDMFNTLGLPTSTTVSIVFELLGAAVAMGTIKIMLSSGSLAELPNYINIDSAVKIVTGIFMSVGIAFVAGAIVMFFSRLLFSFREEKQYGWIVRIWGGLALMAMSYFLLVKGLKHAPFITNDINNYVKNETSTVLGILFVFWTAVLTIYSMVKKVNILNFVVLFGTFALAMAFASNDLVNFIGVPVAGYESYLSWSTSGATPDNYLMEALEKPIPTNTLFLLLAGLVMAVTLWLSRKARSVTETEVDLGRQDAGFERFKPSNLSRTIVRGARSLIDVLDGIMPAHLGDSLNRRFEAPTYSEAEATLDPEEDKAAFDLIRASVNLAGASILIAIATGMKLPLSTTFVSFMVAMGTSLADRAWGRDSAVYRVSGVLNVIGGWLMTAFVAFSVASIFATLIYYFQGFAVAGLLATALFLIYRTYLHHRKEEAKKEKRKKAERNREKVNKSSFLSPATAKIGNVMLKIHKVYNGTIDGTINEDRDLLKKAKMTLTELRENNEELGYELHQLLRNLDDDNQAVGHAYLRIYNIEHDLIIAARNLIRNSNRHVNNLHSPIEKEQEERLLKLRNEMNDLFVQIKEKITTQDFSNIQEIIELKRGILNHIDKAIYKQIEGVQEGIYDPLNSRLMFGLLSEMKDITAISARYAKLFNRIELDSDIDWEW